MGGLWLDPPPPGQPCHAGLGEGGGGVSLAQIGKQEERQDKHRLVERNGERRKGSRKGALNRVWRGSTNIALAPPTLKPALMPGLNESLKNDTLLGLSQLTSLFELLFQLLVFLVDLADNS